MAWDFILCFSSESKAKQIVPIVRCGMRVALYLVALVEKQQEQSILTIWQCSWRLPEYLDAPHWQGPTHVIA